jgi:pyruvate dehydrogenase E2 component (dihydrolipoamide acetyltransferase)
MPHEMKMPDLATTGSPVRVLAWRKQPGDAIKAGEILLEIETDKAAMEVEATVSGTLLAQRIAPGAEALAGDVIADIGLAGETPAAPPPRGLFARNRAAAAVPAPARTPAPTPAPAANGIPLSPAQRTAARRLQESKQAVPHFYLETSANAAAMIARRTAALPEKLAWDAFFVRASARALQRFERLAFRFADDRLVPLDADSLGVAVDLDGELFVVPVAAPATKSVEAISREIRAATEALRTGAPEARRLQPGRMTISNLGGTGVTGFTAIINPPEAAILAIGRIHPVVVPKGAGFVVEQRVNLTLSVDHRVVNGRYAADFLSAIVQELESP